MEAIISIYLINGNYEFIKEVPETRPTSERLIKILGVTDKQLQIDIINYFINCAIPKVKPIVMYERKHHDRFRMGNISAYTKTRLCLYFGLHLLKLKFLIVKSFINKFKSANYNLDPLLEDGSKENISFLTAFTKDYYKKNEVLLKLMIPQKRVSARVKELLNDKGTITSEKLIEMATFVDYLDRENVIKFIMRGIKASIFVCKLMFAKMDLHNPFSSKEESVFNIEEIMISNDFIPTLLPAISNSLRENNLNQLKDCIKAFDFLMDKVLNAINKTIEIASGGDIELELNDTIYYDGDIFNF
jgi:hypothetical protein